MGNFWDIFSHHKKGGGQRMWSVWSGKACPVKLILLLFYFRAQFLDVFYRKLPSYAVVYF